MTVQQAIEAARSAAELGAFWYVPAEAEIASGTGRLAGIPTAVKDAFDVAGMPGGGGGPIATASSDAEAVRRLRAEGAGVIGKLAMHQLGWGMSGQTPGRPLCRNPYSPRRQPGGSSSGSAAAVAAGIVPFALGADSGGSVRVPAAWCGVVGWKPARSACPRDGLLPLADALDAVGVLGRTVADCLLVDAVLRQRAEYVPPPVETLRVGVVRRLLEDADGGVAAACESALRAAGLDLVDAELPIRGVPLAPIFASELAAAWGQEVAARPEGYGDDVRRGVEEGARTPAVEYLGALRAVERARLDARLDVDVLACPASPILPPALEAPDDVGLAGRFTRPFNVLDWPAIVVPCGSSAAPCGLQLAAPPGREAAVFAVAAAVEAARA